LFLKHFFLISQVFYPDEVSTANLFTKLSEKLAQDAEVRVTVWCAQPSYHVRRKQPRNVVHNRVAIRYLPTTQFSKNHKLGRVVNYLTFMLGVVGNLLFSRDKTPVFTHTTPPAMGIIIAFLCKIKKRPFNFILLDIFPEGLIRLGKLGRNSFLSRLWERANTFAYRNSRHIVVIGRDMESWFQRMHPDVASKLKYLPLWQDESLITPMPFSVNPFVKKHHLQSAFVVQYSGNMGLWNDMHTLGLAVNNSDDNTRFVFIGGGMRKQELLEAIDANKKEHFLSFPFLPNEEYAFSVTACHAAIVSLEEGLEGMAVPSKIIGILAAGIPVIAVVPDSSEVARIVREERCGVVVKPGDVEQLSDAILHLKKNPERRKEMAERARAAFEEKYTTQAIARRYKALL
jgi:glycosyltransferase involved in cell wall biosynthesis